MRNGRAHENITVYERGVACIMRIHIGELGWPGRARGEEGEGEAQGEGGLNMEGKGGHGGGVVQSRCFEARCTHLPIPHPSHAMIADLASAHKQAWRCCVIRAWAAVLSSSRCNCQFLLDDDATH